MSSTIAVPATTQVDINAAWRVELRRRIEDILADRVQTLDAETVENQILAELEAMDRQ